jgi:glycine dehydrogenase subunit 1
VSRYTAVTEADREAMLAAIGVDSVDELFGAAPDAVRMGRPIALPDGRDEQAVYTHLRELAARNVSTEDEVSFLGAGMYDSYAPALIEMLTGRSEFLTPYTPYQPEVSQGGLQVMFEYQTAISELTALPVSNASVYEAPSALAAAGYLAKLANGRSRFVVSRGVHPQARETLRTVARGYGVEVVEVGLVDGATDRDAWFAQIDDDTAAAFLQQPNFLGVIEDVADLAAVEALTVCSCDPQTLGILRPPGESGIEIAIGEGQTLGNRLDFGGPSFGFFAAAEQHLRRMPGRIAGETVDADGARGFVLTLQTREQHIRRERATSNICTSQALNALAGVVYLAWLGRRGIVELGELLARRTDFARRSLAAIDGVEVLFDQPVAREFAVRFPGADLPRVEAIAAACRAVGVNPGHPLGRSYPEYEDGLLVALSEQRGRADIDRLVEVLSGAVVGDRAGAVAA